MSAPATKTPGIRDQRGYTLAELLTAMAVLGLLLAGVLLTLQEGQSVYQYGASRAEVQQNARVALDRVLRELRAASTIITSNANDVKFTYLDDTNTSITVEYSLGGASAPYLLQRNQTGGANQPDTLIGGVTNLTTLSSDCPSNNPRPLFCYYDINNVLTTTAANVRSIDIRITTRPEDTTLAAPNVRSAIVEGRVRVRNE